MRKAAAMGQTGHKRESCRVTSRNIVLFGHRTSMRLEEPMWEALDETARRERLRLGELCERVLENKQPSLSFTSAVRVFLLDYFRHAATEEGHFKAGHGVYTNADDAATTAVSAGRIPMWKSN